MNTKQLLLKQLSDVYSGDDEMSLQASLGDLTPEERKTNMLYTVTLNPSIDHTLTVEQFQVGGTFKATHSERLPAGKGINVARVAATLGEPVAALGLVGRDSMPAFAAALAESGIENRLTPVPGAARISVTILDPAGPYRDPPARAGAAAAR